MSFPSPGASACISRQSNRVTLLAVVALSVLVLQGCALIGLGKKQQLVVSDGDAAAALRSEAGLDSMSVAEFAKVDQLFRDNEIATAKAVLTSMPVTLRGTPPWAYRMAWVAIQEGDNPTAGAMLEKMKLKGGWPRGYSELAAYILLLRGEGTKAGALTAEILMREPRNPLLWMYYVEAVRHDPLSQGNQASVNSLIQRYPRLPETRALKALMAWVGGQSDTALAWAKDLTLKQPGNPMVENLYLSLLRNSGAAEEAARAADAWARSLPPESTVRAQLAEELVSLNTALTQRKNDPVPAAVKFDFKPGETPNLAALLPPGVPANDNDPDGMPPDYLDAKGEPLYFLPYRAGSIYYTGVRKDATPIASWSPEKAKEFDWRPKHAFCFMMPQNGAVLAARGGVVQRVAAHQSNMEGNEFFRVIEIYHRDGTYARYWHIGQFGTRVSPGDVVYRGQLIGSIGASGNSRSQHLRFEVGRKAPSLRRWYQVYNPWWEAYAEFESIPIRFADVAEQDGIPREGRWYRSRNVSVPNVY